MSGDVSPGLRDRVLVVGDANVDLVLTGDVVPRFGQAEQLLDGAETVLGGSAAIVACGLARLGVPTALVAVISDDSFGRFTLDALEGAGVHTGAVRVDPDAPTGISVHLSTPGDRAILTLTGAMTLLGAAEVRAAIAATDPAWIHVASPFLIPGLPEWIRAELAEARDAGAGTSLDTNWDPAERWAGIVELLDEIDVLLPNRAELAALGAAAGAAGVASLDQAETDPASALAGLGTRVVVKDGAEGGWSLAPDGVHASAPGLKVDVLDTTGAGDSFDAGYLAALMAGVSPEAERLAWATAAGSLSTRAAGGTAGQASAEELAAALAEARSSRVDPFDASAPA